MNSPEKVATLGTHDEENKKNPNAIYVEQHYTQANTNNVNK